MTTNFQDKYPKETASFQELINKDTPPEQLAKSLVEVTINYSRQLLHFHESGQEGVVPFGNSQDHLSSLIRLIAVLDAGAARPLFSEFNANHSAA